MKICFAPHAADLTGACNSMLNIIDELKKKSVDVIVIIPKPGIMEDKLKKMDVKYYIVKSFSKIIRVDQNNNPLKTIVKDILNYKAKLKIKKILKDENVDLVHINNLTHYVTAIAAKELNIPYVWHLREFLDEDIGFKFMSPKQMEKLVKGAVAKIAISQSIANKFNPIYGQDNMHVIYNGIPTQDYLDYEIPDVSFSKEINLCIIGRISRGKGQITAIEAIKELKDKYSNIKLYVIGSPGYDTEYYERITNFVKDNNLENNVEFVAFTTELKQYRAKCPINLVCSKKEAFGRVTVEAMLANQLVIASNTGGSVELIENGVSGFLYKEGDAKDLAEKIENIIKNPELCKKIIVKAKEEATEKYSINNTSNNVLNLYNELLNSK